MIKTEQLILRPLRNSDLEALCALFLDPEVMRYSINGTKTPEDVKVWLQAQIEESESGHGIELLAVNNKSAAKVIGYCGLTLFTNIDGDTEIEIGYRLTRMYWGNGYATEAAGAVRDYAFTKLQINRLVALIEPSNTRSIAVAQKIGMSYEKEVLLPEYDHPDHLYSMKRNEA